MNTEEILKQRGSQYGEYADNARVMQALKTALRSGVNWEGLPDIAKESLECICLKLGRIVNGSWTVRDNWADLIGYAQLTMDKLPPVASKEVKVTVEIDAKEALKAVDEKISELRKEIEYDPEAASYYTREAIRRGVTRPEAKEQILREVYGSEFFEEPNRPGTPADGGHHEPKLYLRRRDLKEVTFNELPEDDQVYYMDHDPVTGAPGLRGAKRLVPGGEEPTIRPVIQGLYRMRDERVVQMVKDEGVGRMCGQVVAKEGHLTSERPCYDSQGLATLGRAYDLMEDLGTRMV